MNGGGQVLGGGMSKAMLFRTAREADVTGVGKVLTKRYHFPDSRASELAS